MNLLPDPVGRRQLDSMGGRPADPAPGPRPAGLMPWLAAGLAGLLLAGCEPLVYRPDHARPADDGARSSRVQRFLTTIATTRPNVPVPGNINGERVIAESSASSAEGCVSVLVTYQDLDHSETWNVCPGGTASRAAAMPQRLPAGADFKAIRHAATRAASRYGRSQLDYADYEITARTTSIKDGQGCIPVETTVALDGRIIDKEREPVCGN